MAKNWKGINWKRVYERLDAIFECECDLNLPHIELSDGLHTNIFIKGKKITENQKLCEKAARELVSLLNKEIVAIVERVISPNKDLAEAISKQIEAKRGSPCRWSHAVKVGDGKNKRFAFPDIKIFAGENILLCDDTLTTGSTIKAMRLSLKRICFILPIVLAPWNRSGKERIGTLLIKVLVDEYKPVWTAAQCRKSGPCKSGSKALRPTPKNWELFKAKR